jgi:LacI family transcriptional regulator
LIDLGHRRIAVISGPQTTSSAEDRVIGYRLALSEAGIPIDERLIRRGEFRSTSGEVLTHGILDEGLSPTAIFATNSSIAFGCIAAMGQRGLRIPQDIALVCFDDFPYLSKIFPFLSVVVQPAYEMGFQAAQLLLGRLQGTTVCEPCQVVLPTYLIIRYSCGSRGDDLSLPILSEALPEERIPVPALSSEERREISRYLPGIPLPASS